MQLSNFTLLKSGSNSHIYRYGDDQSAVILKAVETSCHKQIGHLINEYKLLKKLNHYNIVNVLKYKQNVKLNLDKINKKSSIKETQVKYNEQENYNEKILQNYQTQTRIQDISYKLYNILIMQSASQGNLLDFYKRNSSRLLFSQIRSICLSIAKGLEYLHMNYIAHRDLKLQNILVFQYQDYKENDLSKCKNVQINQNQNKKRIKLKIGDFGFSQIVYQITKDQRQASQVYKENIKFFKNYKGTKRGYMAPQIHQCLHNPQKRYNALSCDIFAFGVILFCIVLGKMPFEYGNKQNRLYKMIKQKNYQLFWAQHQKQLNRLQLKEYSMIEQFKYLFLKMVQYQPQQRYNIKNVIQSGWLKCVGFDINNENFITLSNMNIK